MKDLLVNGKKLTNATIRVIDETGAAATIIDVDGWIKDEGAGFRYQKRKEPNITVFGKPTDTEPVFTGTHQQLVEKLTYNHQSLLETLFQITYEMGFQKFYSGNTMADMATAIDIAKRFEQEHKDTDWDQEDWLSATSEFIEEEINKLKKEE